MKRLLITWALLIASSVAFSPVFALEVPMLTGRVVDNAELMSAATRDKIAATLKTHEDTTSNQVVVLTIPTLEEENVEGYAQRVFDQWKLGKKGKDNGVLLLVVPKERKLRIAVGYGLEGELPDVAASRIIRNVIAPPFKAKQFDEGMEAGVAAILGQLEGKGVAANLLSDEQEKSAKQKSSGFQEPNLKPSERLLFGAFIFGIIGLFTIIGIFTPGMGWFLYLFLIPFWAMFPIIVVGVKATMIILGIYVIGFPIAKLLISRSDWYKRQNLNNGTRRGRWDGVNHSSGGWSSSSGSGSSWGSSDSFSGGGGDSGGGGSSGDY
jgi:uncharacterized protein